MTERLQEILNRKPSKWGNLTVKEFEGDIKLLQERVQELESESSKYEARINNLTFDLAVSRVQNKRYREALEEIKKEETVTTALSEGQVAYTISGHIARKALEREG